MTRNQIEYWNTQETKRHNVVTEGETAQHNRVTEAETQRHNMAAENIDISKLTETSRHNLATESQAMRELAETQRHNVQQERYNFGNLAESTRHNKAVENETSRHNQRTEDIDLSSVLETGRHNTETENLTAQKQEYEKRLSDVRAALQQAQLDNNLPYAQLKEAEARINQIETENWYTVNKNKREQIIGAIDGVAKLLNIF